MTVGTLYPGAIGGKITYDKIESKCILQEISFCSFVHLQCVRFPTRVHDTEVDLSYEFCIFYVLHRFWYIKINDANSYRI